MVKEPGRKGSSLLWPKKSSARKKRQPYERKREEGRSIATLQEEGNGSTKKKLPSAKRGIRPCEKWPKTKKRKGEGTPPAHHRSRTEERGLNDERKGRDGGHLIPRFLGLESPLRKEEALALWKNKRDVPSLSPSSRKGKRSYLVISFERKEGGNSFSLEGRRERCLLHLQRGKVPQGGSFRKRPRELKVLHP